MTSRVRQQVKSLIQPTIDVLGTTSSAYVGVKSQLNDMAGDMIRFDRPPTTEADHELRRFIAALRPFQCPEPGLKRFGVDGDGGYLMWAGERPDWALSLGVGTDVSWDLDVARSGARVAMFDPTVRRLPQTVPNGQFFRTGLGASDSGRYKPLAALVAMTGFPVGQVAWLKMDVEGAEWSSIGAQDEASISGFSQMVLELHDLHGLADPEDAARINSVIGLLTRSHKVVHVHANNYSRLVRFGSYWFPDAIEVSLVHVDHMAAAIPATTMDFSMDRACDPRVSDIDLSGMLAVHPHE